MAGGGEQAASALEALRDRVHAATQKVANDGALIIQRQAQVNATINPRVRTGDLRRSIKTTLAVAASIGRWTASVAPTVVYARIQELGGTILPKRGPYLRWHDGSGWHYAKSVTLPPRPYLAPAALSEASKVRSHGIDVWNNALRG